MIKALTEAHPFECKILLGQGNQFSRYLLTYTSTFDISINCMETGTDGNFFIIFIFE